MKFDPTDCSPDHWVVSFKSSGTLVFKGKQHSERQLEKNICFARRGKCFNSIMTKTILFANPHSTDNKLTGHWGVGMLALLSESWRLGNLKKILCGIDHEWLSRKSRCGKCLNSSLIKTILLWTSQTEESTNQRILCKDLICLLPAWMKCK